MKKIIYCNGDSWTYGEEIDHHIGLLHINEKYYNTWPWFLSQELEIPICLNEGVGAGSNERIYRKTFDFIKNYIKKGKNPKDLMVVIGWTTPERTEIPLMLTSQIEHVRITPHSIIGIGLLDDQELLKDIEDYRTHYFNLYNEKIGINNLITYMDNLRFLCKELGILYYDFIAIGYSPDIIKTYAEKRNIILDNFFDEGSFNEFVVKNNWSTFIYKHPTPETYKKWSLILKNFIKK